MPISFCTFLKCLFFALTDVLAAVTYRYMDDSAVQEEGTHDDLLKRGGEYARIWNLQAKAFL